MGKKDSNPLPLLTYLSRKRGWISGKAHAAAVIQPLPEVVDLEFWIPGRPRPKGQGFQMSKKGGGSFTVQDRETRAAEEGARDIILDTIEYQYPWIIPYLPLRLGAVGVAAWHLYPPYSDWWDGEEMVHTQGSDVDNLGKLVKDAGAARAKGTSSLLYWDDVLVDYDYQVKVWWNQYHAMSIPNYPQQAGSLFAVRMRPLTKRPHYLHCPWCHKAYREQDYPHFKNHLDSKCTYLITNKGLLTSLS